MLFTRLKNGKNSRSKCDSSKGKDGLVYGEAEVEEI
jgi:hypothetical protein